MNQALSHLMDLINVCYACVGIAFVEVRNLISKCFLEIDQAGSEANLGSLGYRLFSLSIAPP